jgi:hypothetical protein
MDQQLSRPVRWRMATTRGIKALSSLRELRGLWIEKLRELQVELEDLRDRQSRKVKEFEDALGDLICLQSEYDCWNVPENLEYSRVRSKLDDVQSTDFQRMLDRSREMTGFPVEDELEEAVESSDDPYEYAIAALDEARELDLPKGYGRD